MTTIAPPFAPNAQDNLSLYTIVQQHPLWKLVAQPSRYFRLLTSPGSAERSCCWLARSELSIVTVDDREEGFAHCQSCAVLAAAASVASPRNGAVGRRHA